MSLDQQNLIDKLALPNVMPRIGENLARLYNYCPPSPIRARSTLRRLPLTPSDFAAAATEAPVAASDTPRGRGMLTSSYDRFFTKPTDHLAFNDLHAHRSGRLKTSRGSGQLFDTYLVDRPHGDVAPCIPQPPSSKTPRPLSITPLPPPPKSFADRMLAQSDLEEQQLLARIAAMKQSQAEQRSTPREVRVERSQLRNMFLESQGAPQASPRKRVRW